MGNILSAARTDAMRIISSGGFQTDITITVKSVTNTIKGMGLVHHLSFDTDGAPVNSKQAHITVSEKILTDAGFTVRNSNNEVYLINAIVKFADFSGVEKSYTVKENFADDTLGVIFLMLGKYA